MKKLLIATVLSVLGTASIASATCIAAGDGKPYCGKVIIRY